MLAELDTEIQTGRFRNKINYALFTAGQAGREAGGLDRPETFQVFVPSYITFFNDQNPQCDDICWGPWPWQSEPKLTTGLRKRLNDFTRQVNDEIKKAAKDLERLGAVYVEGLEEEYNGHRYCEPGHTSQEMVDYDTWFWTHYSAQSSSSEGPGDPNQQITAVQGDDIGQKILDFVFPGQDLRIANFSTASPPWKREGAEKYPTTDDLFKAMEESDDPSVRAVPFKYQRSFHPKGTAYGKHATHLFSAIADNRDVASADAGSNAKAPAPKCATDGTSFAQPPVEDFISTFCGNKDYWNTLIVPPISYGNGNDSAGVPKAFGNSDSFDLPGTSNKLWLDLSFSTDGCVGSFMFAQGKDDASKLAHCKARFDTILNGCQTNTIDSKLGGTLDDVCAIYSVTAAPKDKTVFGSTIDTGAFKCKPTDTSATGGDTSLFANTCTCWYSNFPKSTDVFKMPKSGNCDDTDKTALLLN